MRWDDIMSKTFLEAIVNHKKEEVKLNRRRIPEAVLLKKVRENRSRRSLAGALGVPDKINIIAEIKRASPSKGVLNESLHATKIAQVYEQAGGV